MKKILVLIILFFLSGFYGEVLYAQKVNTKKKNRRMSKHRALRPAFEHRYSTISLNLNYLSYMGDLSPRSSLVSTDFLFFQPGAGISFERKYGPRYSFRANFNWGRIGGDDFRAKTNDTNGALRYTRNLHFRNDIKELSAYVVFDLISNEREYYRRTKFNPYAFIGLAVFHHNPKAIAPEFDLDGNLLEEGGQWVDLRPLGTEGQNSEFYEVKPYSLFQFAIPLGVGLRYKLGNHFELALEVSYRQTFTDYLDDVSGDYIDLGALDNKLAQAMSDRSRELTASFYDEARDIQVIQDAVTGEYTYDSKYASESFTVFNDFGDEGYIRGNPKNNDTYITTSLRITYIIADLFKR